MKKIICILVSVSSNLFYSQKDINSIFPPNPEVSSLLSSTMQNMNLSEGTASISIPIFSLTQGNITYPMTLSYISSSGIKVNDVAGSVGLGWALNSKSMLTRIVRDLPDDIKSSGYMYTPYNIANIKSLLNTSQGTNEFFQLKNQIDSEPDEFIISCPGQHIKIYYNRDNNTFFSTPSSDIKLEPDIDPISGQIVTWVITLPNANKYYFGHNNLVEKSTHSSIFTLSSDTPTEGNTSTGGEYITSWYLYKIEDSNNRAVTFEYENEFPYNFYTKIEESKIIDYQGTNNLTSINKKNYSSRRIEDKILKKIIANNVQVIFNSSFNNRLDNPSKSLSSIEIKHHNNIIKKVEFSYSYFNADTSYDYDNYNGIAGTAYRLKLNEVSVISNGNIVPEKYRFEYNETVNLPMRNSYAQDAWGFFNGKNNMELIPTVDANYIINGMNGFWGSANRSISPSHTTANILTKITFPTGGNIVYNYEPNDASVIANLSYPFNFSPTLSRNEGLFADVIQTPTCKSP